MPAGVRSLGAIAPLKARGIDIGRKYLAAGGKLTDKIVEPRS